MHIGVLALQGGFQAHIDCLNKLGVFCSRVRDRRAMTTSDALIIPGGESSVLIKLLKQQQLWTSLIDYDKPILGICAGAILLAKTVLSPTQDSLGRISICATRNAYGRQLASQVVSGQCMVRDLAMEMVFIRAPKLTLLKNADIKVLAKYHDQIVAVQENNVIAASFHPELSQDNYLHRYFVQQVACSTAKS
ncbi:pyridoxal 5'-phosphate synthase glutaminase subunit PdxT [Rickettsiella endosymbiont of Rhagonycha lignosa]|uniref:pyridoxal 5'-phosphate synthase glutaminase subunit PdxT n=1 Tax=Rickettsiella endosymbiont of Rhagonycha lignosa TaxID=3077937 RepID=UPI00313DE02C